MDSIKVKQGVSAIEAAGLFLEFSKQFVQMDDTIKEVSGKLEIEREDGDNEIIHVGYTKHRKGRIFVSEPDED
jgi:hypothetical protein